MTLIRSVRMGLTLIRKQRAGWPNPSQVPFILSFIRSEGWKELSKSRVMSLYVSMNSHLGAQCLFSE